MSNPIKPTKTGSSHLTSIAESVEPNGSSALKKSELEVQVQDGHHVGRVDAHEVSQVAIDLADQVRSGELSAKEVLDKLVDHSVDVSIEDMLGDAKTRDLRNFLKNALDDDPVLLEMLQELEESE